MYIYISNLILTNQKMEDNPTTYIHNNGINEDTIVNKDYFNQINNQQILTCCICDELLNDPLMCSKCQTSFCKHCINSWLSKSKICPMQCQNSQYVEVSKVLKSIMDGLIIKCELCGEQTTLFKYPKHSQTCSKPKCFNCGSEVNNLNTLKIRLEKENEKKKLGMFGNKIVNIIKLPNEVKDYIVFHIYITNESYQGFLYVNVDKNKYIEPTQYRPNASFFKIIFRNGKKNLMVYVNEQNTWLYVGLGHDKAIRATSYENKMCNVDINIEERCIKDCVKNKEQERLTCRKTNKRFYFCEKTDEYQQCDIDFHFLGRYSLYDI